MSLFGSDYDSVQVGGEFKALPAGGYICRIVKAQLTKSSNGLPMVEAIFDICEGEFSNYFSNKYSANLKKNPATAKYPANGRAKVIAVDAEGRTRPTFKGFVTVIEESNDIKMPREDNAFINALAGKLIGVIFGREEFEGDDGKTHWATKPRWYRSVQAIESGDYQVPEDVYLSKSSYDSGMSTNYSSADALFGNNGIPDTFSAIEDDIPF